MVRTAGVLKDAGAEVLVATCDWEFGGIRKELARNGVRSVDIVMRGMFTRRGGVRRVVRMLFEATRSAFRLRRAAKAFAPTHIVFPDEANFLYAVPSLVGRGATTSVYVPANVPDEERAAASRGYRFFFAHVVSRLSDRVVANSEFTAAALRRHLRAGTPLSLVRCCAPAREPADSDPALSTVDPGRFNIVFVGQLARHKGVDLLLDAALTLMPDPDVDVIIAGPIDERHADYAAWRAQVQQSGYTHRIRFIGAVRDVPGLLARAAVHVMPSRCPESFGLMVLEAKLAGVPSVVLPVGALPELVRDKVDGVICNDVSVASLAEGLRYFVRDRHRLAAARVEASLSAESYSFDRFLSGWVQVLRHEPLRH